MRHTRLAVMLGALFAFPVSVFAFSLSPFDWFGGETATALGRRHDPSHEIKSNGVTKVQMRNLYQDDYLVTDVDVWRITGQTNLVAGENITIEDVEEGRRISATDTGITNLVAGENIRVEDLGPDGRTMVISATSGAGITNLVAGKNITIEYVGPDGLTRRISSEGGKVLVGRTFERPGTAHGWHELLCAVIKALGGEISTDGERPAPPPYSITLTAEDGTQRTVSIVTADGEYTTIVR